MASFLTSETERLDSMMLPQSSMALMGFVEIGWGEVNSGVEVVKPKLGILAYRVWVREGCGQVHHREKAEGGFVMRR